MRVFTSLRTVLRLLQTRFPTARGFMHGCTDTCLVVVGGWYMWMSFSLSPLRTEHCYIYIFITIWCVGDEFTSLSAGQVSADSCMCCNWQLHRKTPLVVVQHHCRHRVLYLSCVRRNALCSKQFPLRMEQQCIKHLHLHFLTYTPEFHC